MSNNSKSSFRYLDSQLSSYGVRLRSEIGLTDLEITKVATLVAAEVRFLKPSAREEVINASPVPLRDRLDELTAFQGFMDWANQKPRDAAIVRGQVIIQNYVCFFYLSEACFKALRHTPEPESVTRRCCKFLTDNPVRAFRNAIAHSNWTYSEDFRGLVYWARKGSNEQEALTQFNVSQEDLAFWKMLSRVIAYSAFQTLQSVKNINLI